MAQLITLLHGGAKLVDFGLDWLRVSMTGPLAESAPSFDVIRAWYDQNVLGPGRHDSPRPSNLLGYVGRAYGAAWVGERKGDVLFQCTGQAARHALTLPGLWLGKATRIDIQATVRLNDPVYTVIKKAADAADHRRRQRPGRPFGVRHIDGRGDGDSAYIGSRHSEVMVRVYDKYLESGCEEHWAMCARFEAEIKGEAAVKAWAGIAGSRDPRGVAAGILSGILGDRGLEDVAALLGVDALPLVVERVQTDGDRQLAWLERSVRGIVKKLLLDGRAEEVYDALGLDKYGVAPEV